MQKALNSIKFSLENRQTLYCENSNSTNKDFSEALC